MKHIMLNGHPTWAQLPKKGGDVVVLLHGGMSHSESLIRKVGPRLATHFRLGAFDRRGHGRSADTDEPFSYESMADEAIAYLEYIGRRAHVVGHSDGGNVALLVALRRPDLVRRVVVIGANFHYEGLVAPPTVDFESEGFMEWTTAYGVMSPNGAAHAKVMAVKSERMMNSGPTLDVAHLRQIEVPVLVMAGDDDVATLAHTCAMFEAIPESQLAIVPGTSHALLKERPKECTRIITRFLTGDSPPITLMPIRRARTTPEA